VTSSTWQALGNAYVLVEPGAGALDPGRARALAAGADGVLEVVSADDHALEVIVWNADGSRAELSGNGTRIAACWHFERTGARSVRITVGLREVGARLLDDGRVEQDLGPVEVGPPETVDEWEVIPVSLGNPHAVVLGDPAEITRVGPALESHPRFPQRTNVQVARVDGPGVVTARVWERGVGETSSSGTSAVAVAAATHGDGDVAVRFPGGVLRVRLEGGRARLVAPAATRLA
jgi:diaminopimelate epimerase